MSGLIIINYMDGKAKDIPVINAKKDAAGKAPWSSPESGVKLMMAAARKPIVPHTISNTPKLVSLKFVIVRWGLFFSLS